MYKAFEMPLAGPSTYEETVARLQESEREIAENGGRPWDKVLFEASKRVEEYAAAIY